MTPEPPSGQQPIDPRGAFSPPPPPNQNQSGGGWSPPPFPAEGAPPPPPRQSPPPPGGFPPPPGGFPPPMMMMPPPMYYPPPRPEKSFTRAIFMTLATTIFGLSLLLNIYLIGFSGLLSGPVTKERTLVDGSPTEIVAVIPLTGVIDSESYERFNRLLTKLEEKTSTKAIVIEIESPGGTVTASDEIYNRIKMFKEKHQDNVPVIISMRSVAASGGYYVACAGDYVFAEPTTITGSIGVLLPKYNLSRLADKWGIEDTSQHSTGADYKTAGSPLKPERPMDSAYFQSIIDQSFQQFKDIVTAARDNRHVGFSIDAVANGKIFLGPEAEQLGLVDRLGYPQDAWAYAAQQASLKNPSVIQYEEPQSFIDLLGAQSSVSGLKGSAGNTINVNLNVDVQRMLNGHSVLMYLYRAE